jgi:hypothetical protein
MDLKYSFFDFDDNLLHLDTKITMEFFDGVEWTPINLSTPAYAMNRNNPLYRIPQINGQPDYDTAFANFRDIEGKQNTFFEDCVHALNKGHFAPSYEAFKRCMINGHHLFIVTARGHEPQTIKNVVRHFVYEHLTTEERIEMRKNIMDFVYLYNTPVKGDVIEDYLDECQYIGVSSYSFAATVQPHELPAGTTEYDIAKTEIGKEIVIKRFITKCIANRDKAGSKVKSISIGFSDDDLKNVKKITETFTEAKAIYPDVKFVIYDTSRNEDGTTNYIKNIIT